MLISGGIGMRLFVRAAVVVTALAMLAGCANKPAIPYDQTSAGKIRTIGILTPAMPSGPTVHLNGTVGQSFGLVGALIDAGMESSRESDFEDVLASHQFDAEKLLVTNVKQSLEKQGYKVVDVPVTRQSKTEFMETYPTASGADAYLDIVVLSYGYIGGVIGGTPYRPLFETEIRMVDADDASVLMEDKVQYASMGLRIPEGYVKIAPDPKYTFDDFDTLTSQSDIAVEGLDVAFEKSADAMGTLLR